MPRLTDAEVLMMKCVGEFLGPDADTYVFALHFPHFFPALTQTHRITFPRQAANFWHLKELVWRRLAAEVARADDSLHIVNSMAVHICRFTGIPFCQHLRRAACYGKDHADRQTFYGFRLGAPTCPGLISEAVLAPTNQSEQSLLAPLASCAPAGCVILGDRIYSDPSQAADGQRLVARQKVGLH